MPNGGGGCSTCAWNFIIPFVPIIPIWGPQYAFNGAEQVGEGEKEEEMKQRSDYLTAILAGF